MSKAKAHIQYRSRVDFYKNGKGLIFPGVTTICGILAKPALIKWANNLGLNGIDSDKYVDDKADIGTLGHAMITNKMLGKKTNTDDYTRNQIDKAENCLLSYLEWSKGHSIEPVLIEEPLVSESLKFGGMSDIYGVVDGVKELIDLKTGSGIYSEHFIQTSAYRHLLIENGHEVDRIRILNIPRAETEVFQEAISPTIDEYWQIFEHCLGIYNLRKQVKDGRIIPDRKTK